MMNLDSACDLWRKLTAVERAQWRQDSPALVREIERKLGREIETAARFGSRGRYERLGRDLVERRYAAPTAQTRARPTLREAAIGGDTITGYAALFDSPTRLYADVSEIIRPGAFDRVLRERQNVRALFNHDANYVLGSIDSGTLLLRVDDLGLYYKLSPFDSPLTEHAVAAVRSGAVAGSSFAFIAERERVTTQPDGSILRELLEIRNLYDVGPVTYPAYADTTADVPDPAEVYSGRHVGTEPSILRRRLDLAAKV